MAASHRWVVRPTDPEPSLDPSVAWGDWHHWAFDELFVAREPSSREHHAEREYSASAKSEAPAALAAEGEARVHAGASVTVMLVIGFALTGGPLKLWPHGLFDLVSEGTAGSLVFIALGAAPRRWCHRDQDGNSSSRSPEDQSGRGRKGAQRIRERAEPPAVGDREYPQLGLLDTQPRLSRAH